VEKEERRALEMVLSKNVLPLLVAKNVNFSVLWNPKNLRIRMAKNTFRMLQESNRWFKSINIQKSVVSTVRLKPKDASPPREITISGKIYISRPEIVIILKASFKKVQ